MDGKILLLPAVQECAQMYRVSIQQSAAGVKKRIVEFELGLQPFREIEGNMEWKVFKDNFLLDGLEPQNIIDDMNRRIGTMLYPVYVQSDVRGILIHVIPGAAIKGRWQGLQQELNVLYKGPVFEAITASVNEIIDDPLLLKNIYTNDLLLRLLFIGVYGTYNEKWCKIENVLLPIGEYAPKNVNMQLQYQLLSAQKKIIVTGRNTHKSKYTVHVEGYILLDEITHMPRVTEMNIVETQRAISVKINSM